uniref:(northern house mosquito) hypothetical protein n=1 Tax=Culex pipiens TaxID=7175 RepID=A0A8D7ZZ15_CULPI
MQESYKFLFNYIYIYTVRMGFLNLGTCGHCCCDGDRSGKLLLQRSLLGLSVDVIRHVTYTSETADGRHCQPAATSVNRRYCHPAPGSARQSAPPCFVRAAPTDRPARLPGRIPATAVR